MNWARGLFRLWLVLSVIWIVAVAMLFRPDQVYASKFESTERAKELATEIKAGLADGNLAFETNVKVELLKETDKEILWRSREIKEFLVIGPGLSGLMLLLGVLFFG